MSGCTLFSTIKLVLHIFWGKQELLLLHAVMHFSWLRTKTAQDHCEHWQHIADRKCNKKDDKTWHSLFNTRK